MLCVALGTGAMAAPMMSSARVYVDVSIAPPPARVEVVPVVRRGYVWAPGYWNWSGRRYVWVRGQLLRERRGYHWYPQRCGQRGDRWHFERGHWDRD